MGDLYEEYDLLFRQCSCGCGSKREFEKLEQLEKKIKEIESKQN